MAYSVEFIINGRHAMLEQTFERKTSARDVAAGIEEEGYPTEIVEETQ